jgi:hypothetical protein
MRYYVEGHYKALFEVPVEAESVEEAEQKVKDMSASDLMLYEHNWSIYIEEVMTEEEIREYCQ